MPEPVPSQHFEQYQELVEPKHPDVHTATLGRLVVGATQTQAFAEVNRDRLQRAGEHTSAYEDSVTEEEREPARGSTLDKNYDTQIASSEILKNIGLKKIRDRFKRLSQYEKYQLVDYFESKADKYADIWKPMSDNPLLKGDRVSWTTWVDDYLPDPDKVDDALLTNVVQWHNHQIAEQQESPEFKQWVEAMKLLYEARVADKAEKGVICSMAPHRAEWIKNFKVQVGDIFDTTLQRTAAYHVPNTDALVVSQDATGNVSTLSLLENFTHEANHATIGKNSFDIGPIDVRKRWIDEALTEHTAKVLEDRVDPQNLVEPGLILREQPNQSYVEERMLLTVLGADPRLALLAFTGGEQDKQAFADDLHAKWGENILGRVNQMIKVEWEADTVTNKRFAERRAIVKVIDQISQEATARNLKNRQ